MNRIRPIAIGFAVVLTLAVASLAQAQENKEDSYSGAVSGAIVTVDATSITVKGPNDDGGTFAINADTQVMSGGKTITADALKKDKNVVVSWDYAAPNSQDKVAKLIDVTEQ
jgi:hypothetical protein